MLGDKLPAQQAADWGLIWKCVDDAEFTSTVDALLAQLAQAPTRGLAATKRALYASATATLDAQLDLERDLQRELGLQRRLSRRRGGIPRQAPAELHRRVAMANALPREAEVGVIGAGAMGVGIAQLAAQAGHRVQLFDTRMGAADQAKTKLGETLVAAGGRRASLRDDADAAIARVAAGRTRSATSSARSSSSRRSSRTSTSSASCCATSKRSSGRTRSSRPTRRRCRSRRSPPAWSIRAASSACTSSTRRRVMPLVEVVSGARRSRGRRGRVRHAPRLGQDAGARARRRRASSSTAAPGRSTARRCGC